MNRYTYKAKRKDNSEWVYGYYVLNDFWKDNYKHYIVEHFNLINSEFKPRYHEIIPETICQCTGLQDRDCEDIFENDIVEDIDTGDVCYLVVFDEAKFKLNKNSVNYDIDGVRDFKIISNKFDKEED